jgi:hypothetical protein
VVGRVLGLQDIEFIRFGGGHMKIEDVTLCAISWDYLQGNRLQINITKRNKHYWRYHCAKDPIGLFVRLFGHESIHKALYSTVQTWKFKRSSAFDNLSKGNPWTDGLDGIPIKLCSREQQATDL